MRERDLRPGCASIAVRGTNERADPSQSARALVPRLVWVFYVDIIDSVLLFVAPLDPASETSGCRAT